MGPNIVYLKGEKFRTGTKWYSDTICKIARILRALSDDDREPSIFSIIVRTSKRDGVVFTPWYSWLDRDERYIYKPEYTPMEKLEKWIREIEEFESRTLLPKNVIRVDFRRRAVSARENQNPLK